LRQNASAKLKTKFHQKLWNSYKEGFTGECTLQVNGTKFKVSTNIFKIIILSLGVRDCIDCSFRSFQTNSKIEHENKIHWRDKNERFQCQDDQSSN
jgi:hypothetical protein